MLGSPGRWGTTLVLDNHRLSSAREIVTTPVADNGSQPADSFRSTQPATFHPTSRETSHVF